MNRREGFHHVGNSTHWIVLGGVAILTDPWVTEPADHAISHRVPPIPLPTSPDLVLLTHRHGDHFDLGALALIDRKAVVVVEEDLAPAIRALGFGEVLPVRPGQRLDVRGLFIDVVRGRHSCPEVCYRVQSEERALFLGGDTMVTPEIEALASEKPVPFAVLPGERSRLLFWRFVMTPEEAIALAKRFRVQRAVLTHHEQVVSDWLGRLFVRVPPPEPASFPDWFTIPAPGDFIPFPWEAA